MAVWGAGAILGPILGPAIGGYLTEHLSWRWCFYINLPVGIIALLGVWLFISHDEKPRAKPFDFLGFGMLTVFISAFQLVVDRGPSQDWFGSKEIWIEATVAAVSLWIFLVHTLTAKHPFFDRALARDRNFVTACIFGFFIGTLLFSTMAVLPPMMQVLLGYPVVTAGLVSMPRGLGSFISMFFVGRLIGRVDTRLILAVGLMISAVSLYQMMHFDLSMTSQPLIVSGLVQGLGIGLIFVPMSALAFATVPPHLRSEGSAVYTLVRNLGAAVGISIVQALISTNNEAMHSSLAAQIDPANPVVRDALGPMLNSTAGLMALNGQISRQAAMVAYVDIFKLMFIVTLACLPMLLLMRGPKRKAGGEDLHVAVE
jgi:DHA2 family multidrug resistance protein